uniref:Putative pre-16S rRNA nuclease n=1 Tax=Desulfobacca acetoxidans TaxID=60893 RepID=A0A7C3V5C2_9BACT
MNCEKSLTLTFRKNRPRPSWGIISGASVASGRTGCSRGLSLRLAGIDDCPENFPTFGAGNKELLLTTDRPAKPGEVRILALDVGQKRIGLAISDPLGLTAQGLAVLERQDWDKDLARMLEIARPYKVQEVLVGLPRHMDGRLGEMAAEILALGRALAEALGAELATWDERLTTVEAERLLLQADMSRKKRRQVVDQVAASLILQAYLDGRGKRDQES